MNLIFIALGGALGAVLRFFCFEATAFLVRGSNLAHFPFATLFVNVFGSFLAGCFYFFVVKNFSDFDPRLKNFVMFGFLGAFTTFSAFSVDFFRLFEAGRVVEAVIYVSSSVFLAILAMFFGYYAMRLL